MVTNQKVSAKIGTHLIKEAKIYKDISFEPTPVFKARYYLCHDNRDFNGSESPDKLGYRCSWVFNEFNENCIENGHRFTEHVSIYEGELKEITFSEKIRAFIEMEETKLFNLFEIKGGKFEKYDSIDVNKEGLLILSSSELNRTMEMKVGRFLRALADENPELFEKPHCMFGEMKIDNHILEDITNNLHTFNNEDHVKIKLVSGNDILEGYTRDNYFNNKGGLGGSCMTDKLSFLELYTKNPNIELAIFYFKNKIVARCLVWNIDGVKRHDRIYYSNDWAFVSITKSLKEMGIESIFVEQQFIFQLEHIPNFFPYLDTMKFLDSEKKLLTNQRLKNAFNKRLCSQSGEFDILSNSGREVA